MKTITYITLTVYALTLSACTTSADTPQVISVLEDVTETHFVAQPNTSSIIGQFNLEANLWKGAIFRYGQINSLIHNKREAFSLESNKALLGNELERRSAVKTFQNHIQQALKTVKDSTAHHSSSIWKPLVEELKSLQQLPNTNSVLYLFSDLQENSNWFSVHRYKDLQQLHTDKEAVWCLFLKQAEDIIASQTLTVVVVYQPRTLKEDEAFSKMKALYQTLFQKLGIPIVFTSHINSN